MHLAGILAAAIATLVCLSAAFVSVIGLLGSRRGWLDVVNHFAPVVLIAALFGAGLAWLSPAPGPLRASLAAFSLFAAVCNGALIIPELVRITPTQYTDGMRLRVLSANVWSGNPSPELAISAILSRDADVVMLQESDGSIAPSLERLRARYPYASDCRWSGVQTFLKAPILAQGCGLGLGTAADRQAVWVGTALPDGRRMTLVNVHLPQPIPPTGQEAMRKGLAGCVQALGPHDLIVAGDFNTTPWSYAMRRQDRMLRPLSRRTIALSSWPARSTRLGAPWWAPFLPIDHIYADPAWRLAGMRRLRIPGSDHFAVEADLYLRPGTLIAAEGTKRRTDPATPR